MLAEQNRNLPPRNMLLKHMTNIPSLKLTASLHLKTGKLPKGHKRLPTHPFLRCYPAIGEDNKYHPTTTTPSQSRMKFRFFREKCFSWNPSHRKQPFRRCGPTSSCCSGHIQSLEVEKVDENSGLFELRKPIVSFKNICIQTHSFWRTPRVFPQKKLRW